MYVLSVKSDWAALPNINLSCKSLCFETLERVIHHQGIVFVLRLNTKVTMGLENVVVLNLRWRCWYIPVKSAANCLTRLVRQSKDHAEPVRACPADLFVLELNDWGRTSQHVYLPPSLTLTPPISSVSFIELSWFPNNSNWRKNGIPVTLADLTAAEPRAITFVLKLA